MNKYKVCLYDNGVYVGEIINLKTKKLKTFRKRERADEWCKKMLGQIKPNISLEIKELSDDEPCEFRRYL